MEQQLRRRATVDRRAALPGCLRVKNSFTMDFSVSEPPGGGRPGPGPPLFGVAGVSRLIFVEKN